MNGIERKKEPIKIPRMRSSVNFIGINAKSFML